MSWEDDFDELLTDTVLREAWASQDVYGEASYSAPAEVQARVVYKTKVLHTAGAGDAAGGVVEVVSKATVYCSGVPEWGDLDRITLPDGSQPLILQVVTYPDEDGPHHQVVYV